MATISDVAKRANVSITTVSRILNGERNVASDTALAVQQAIRELDYVPRAVRPGPKPKMRLGVNTGTIAFLSVGDYAPDEMYRMPAFPALLAGVKRGLDQNGMDLLLAHSPKGEAIPHALERRLVDGVLIYGYKELASGLKQALRSIPAVWCFRDHAENGGTYDHVFYDNSRVGQMAADYLLARGHREVAFASTSPEHIAFGVRKEQFSQIVTSAGAGCQVVERPGSTRGDVRAEAARVVAADLLALKPRPTGVFCASDELMLSVFNRCLQQGIQPGRDLDLVGCNNDLIYMDQMAPRPATVDLKLGVVGERAVDQLIWRMGHLADDSQSELLVKPVLIAAEELDGVPASRG